MPLSGWGQIRFSGKILDEDSLPLPLAVILAEGVKTGAVSDLEGNFELLLPYSDTVKITLLGYEKWRQWVRKSQKLKIVLQPADVQVDEVVITPGINPAMRMMKGAVRNRKQNRPEGRERFHYQSYNKLKFQLELDSTKSYENFDSTDKYADLFIMETVTKKYFRRPSQEKEYVLSSRISGYPERALPLSASDLQTVSLYENYVQVLGTRFLSPVSPPGLNQYVFTLGDTILTGSDSIFRIAFQPKSKNVNGLSGWLQLHSRNWSVVAVAADLKVQEPDILLAGGTIRQIYSAFGDSIWFPIQLNTDVDLKPMNSKVNEAWSASAVSFLSDIHFEPADSVPFNTETVVLDENAGKNDSILAKNRLVDLTRGESRTYHLLDSLGRKVGLPILFDQLNKLSLNRLEFGPLDFDITRLLIGNDVEGTRLGLGLWTNEKVTNYASIGGFGGYGFRDGKWKYGGGLDIKPLGDKSLIVGGRYVNDLLGTGFTRIGGISELALQGNPYWNAGLRNYFFEQMDYVEQWQGFVTMRLPSNFVLRGEYLQEINQPAFRYAFNGDSLFHFREANVSVRWAPGEEFSRQGQFRMAFRNRLPVFRLRFSQGLDDNFGEFNYKKIDFSVAHYGFMLRKSRIELVLNAGWISGPVPLTRSYVFSSSWAEGNWFDIRESFNTMRMGEFAAEQYVEGFATFSPKLRWLNIGPFQPRFSFLLNGAWGRWSNGTGDHHQEFAISAPEKGYLEAGIFIQNLIPKLKNDYLFFSLFRLIGVGAYYRLSSYSFPNWRENVAIRITMAPIW